MKPPFRWGVLGTANIARTFVEAVRRTPDATVRAVASRTLPKAEQWASELGIPTAYGSYDRLLLSGDIDAVYIPLPNSLHREWCLRSIGQGVPALCEKPFTLTARQAASVVKASLKKGVPVAEAFMYRFHPVYERIRVLIANGGIGRLTTIFAQFTFALDDEISISANADLGGGALMDVGCYCVNAARLITGAEPLRASAFARCDKVDRTMTGMLEFPGGVLAHFETAIENFERRRLEIAGTDGAIVLEQPWFPGEAEGCFIHRRPEGDKIITAPGANGYIAEIEVND
ncbi:MAG: gfo/Idh/MocA family oxidoreductase [Myxococcales bacterium]|nr:MAG: gfo/Idh/MocA family oxidoreductase [Myxococcales bacterium]